MSKIPDDQIPVTQITPGPPSPQQPHSPLPARSPVPSSQAGLGSGPGKPASSFMPHSTSVPIQDLKSEAALLAVPRMELDGKAYPALSGIPLLAKLGQGGMGSVYYGVHPRLRKEVAVKILPLHMAGKPDLVQRFFREAQTAAQIQSPHLVGVLDVNEESGHFFLVMEFVSGLSAGGYLRQVKEQGRAGLSEHEVLMIALAAAEGLAAAHAAHIIHRDIKPDNILIPRRKSGREGDPGHLDFQAAKLADLGLARADEMGQSLTGDSSALGTPGYMAPEQAMDAKNALAPADVFSVGATMYSLLSGRAPFTGNTAVQVIFATVKEPHTPFAQLCPHVRPQTAALIERCLAKNPAERFADGAALRDALKACLSTMGLDEPTMRMPKGGTPSNIPAAPLSTPHTPSAPPMRAAPGSAPVFTPPPIPAHTPQPPSQGQRPSHLTPPVGPDGLPPRTGNLIPPRPIGNVPAEPKRRFALNGLEWAFMVFLLFGLNVLGVLQCSYVQLYYGLAGFTVGLSLLGMCAGFMLRFSIGLWLFLLSNILFVAGMTASAYFIGQEMEDQDTVIQGWIMLGCIVYSVGAFCCSGLASLVSAMRSKDA